MDPCTVICGTGGWDVNYLFPKKHKVKKEIRSTSLQCGIDATTVCALKGSRISPQK